MTRTFFFFLGAWILLCMPLFALAQTSDSTATSSYPSYQQVYDQFTRFLVDPSAQTSLGVDTTAIESSQVVNALEMLLQNQASAYTAPSAANQQLINTLLAQVEVLQAQIAALVASGSTSSTQTQSSASVSMTPAGCPVITRTLLSGVSGADVTNLQQFLITEGHLEAGLATGFFGALTQAAVQAWQTGEGIISSGSPEETGWGVVGPLSRAALQNCSQ